MVSGINGKTRLSLSDRVRILEDKDAIRELKARYAYTLDIQDLDGWLDLFAEDGSFELGSVGHYQGNNDLRTLLESIVFPSRPFFTHMYLDPIIEILGRTKAKGTWYMFGPETVIVKGEKKAVWACLRYDDEYVKIKGQWKFKSINVTYIFETSFNKGWVKEKNLRWQDS